MWVGWSKEGLIGCLVVWLVGWSNEWLVSWSIE